MISLFAYMFLTIQQFLLLWRLVLAKLQWLFDQEINLGFHEIIGEVVKLASSKDDVTD